MSAGLVRYRLCDRDFDCERCPLDAALRGQPVGLAAAASPDTEAARPLEFPDDRLYTAGHCWVQIHDAASTRLGLDGLAAALAGAPLAVRLTHDGHAVHAGDPVAALDFRHGSLTLHAPAGGRALQLNAASECRPDSIASDPYGEGWILEIHDSEPWPPRLLDASAALEQARLDLRHFERRAALGLLAHSDDVGATLPDGGEPLTDLRRMLGPRGYLDLVRELLH